MRILIRTAAAMASALMLGLGCGGSHTSPAAAAPPTAPPAPPPVAPSANTISGRVAKGILEQAPVSASELVAGAWQSRGTGLTDGKGNFKLVLTGYSGLPLRLTVTAGAGATMTWDGASGSGHAFGVLEPLPGDLQMSTVLSGLPSGSATGIPITPYSSMADAAVEANLAAATAASILAANQAISTLTGFDVLGTPVADLTDPVAMAAATPAEQRAAAMAAALTFLVPPGGSVATAVANLSQSMASGQFTSQSPVSAATLAQAWLTVAATPELADQLSGQVKSALEFDAASLATAGASGTYTPPAPVSAPALDLAGAKQLVGGAFTVASSIKSADLATLFSQLETAITALSTQGLTPMVGQLYVQTTAALHLLLTDPNLIQVLLSPSTRTYTLTPDTGGQLTLAITGGTALAAHLTGSFPEPSPGSGTVTVDLALSSNLDMTLIDLLAGTTSQTSLQASLTGSVSDGVNSLAIPQGTLAATFDFSTPARVLKSLDIQDLTVTLGLPGASFSVSGGLTLIQADPTKVSTGTTQLFTSPLNLGNEAIGIQRAALQLKASVQGMTAAAGIQLRLDHADQFDLLTALTSLLSPAPADGTPVLQSIVLDNVLSPGQLQAIQAASMAHGATGDWSVIYGTEQAGGSATTVVQGQVLPDSFAAVSAAYAPSSELLQAYLGSLPGSVLQAYQVEVFSFGGTLSSVLTGVMQVPPFKETSAYFAQGGLVANLEFSGIPGLKDSQVIAAIERGSFEGGSAKLSLNWGGESYTVELADLDLAKLTGSLTLSNAAGASLQVSQFQQTGGQVAGVLGSGGVKLADIQFLGLSSYIVTFTDGTVVVLQ